MKFISKPEIALIFPLVFFIFLACSKDAPFPEEPAIVNYNFAVSASEGGSVNSPGDSFAQNTTLTLTATAADGYEFTSWSGDASGTDNPLTVSLTSNTNITANFERIQYTLTVNIVGQGQVNQVLGDNSITSTTVEYNQGDRVTLQTNPGDNWTFSRWQGDATGYEDNFEILVDESKTVTATFDFEVIDDLIGAWDIASDSSSDKKIVKAPNSGKDVICGFYGLIFNPDYSFTLYYSLGTISGEFYIQDPTSISLKNYGSITNISFAANGISFNLELDTGCSSDISGDKDDDYDPENPPKSFLEKLDGKYFRGTWEEYERTFTDLISFKDNLPDDFLDLYWIDEGYECMLGTWNSSHIAEVIENYDDQLTFRYTSGLNFKVLGDASAGPMEGTMSLRSDGTIQIAENFQDDDLDRIYILSEVTQEEFNQIIDSGYCYDIDTTPPIITLNSSSTIQLNIGENWTDPGATATDDLDGDLTSSISVTGSVDASSVGTYTLTYSVSDSASNIVSTTRTVIVNPSLDTTPPVINLTGSSTINLTLGDTFTDPGAAATDDVDGDLTSLISITGSVDTSSVGTYTLTYSVEDAAGNSSSITRTVVVKTPELIIADYRFEGDAQDSSGNSNHGTNNGGVFTTDRFGNQNGAIYFSGASCGTRMDSDIDMSTVINEFSISFWINRTANGCQLPRIFDFYDGGNNSNDWGTAWQNGNNKYQGYDEVSNNNNWYHIVHNFNSNGTLTSFVDGVEVDSRNSGKTLPLSGDFALGRMNHPAYDAFNGKLDDVKMYNYALSQSEINVLFGNYANDTTAPIISLTGSSTINLTVGDTFTDPGATATDNVDGDITSSITTSGSVNTSTAGTYTISYSVSDAAGNTATVVQRTITVNAAAVACSPQTILSADRPTNVYKRIDGTYLLRTTTDVYSSTSLSGPYNSLGFTQTAPNAAANLLGETQNGDILVASESNGLYRYSNGVWTATGLSGGGTGGNNFLRLTSGRIVVGKKGGSRKMYYSDDDGFNWSAASGDIAEDWYNIIQTNNKLFVSSAGDKNKGGIITSLDDGSSWTNLRDQKTYSMEMYNSDIYIVSEEGARGSGVYKIFKSSDDGQSWTFISDGPISGGIGVLIIHDDTIIFKSNSGGDYYCKSLNDLTSDWNLFGTNEDLGTHLIENKIIDDTPLIFTTTQIMSF